MRTYFVGLLDDYNGNAIIECRRNKDYLSCEILEYFGPRKTTKKDLKAKAGEMLGWIKSRWPDRNFQRIVID